MVDMNKISGNKCVICGIELSNDKRINSILKYKATYCDDCVEVAKLQKISIDHWDKFKHAEAADPIEQKNYYEDAENKIYGTKIYTLDTFKKEYKVEGRTKKAEQLIKEIDFARRHIYEDIIPYMLILESMFDKKYTFWKDGGNCWFYIRNSLISYLVIHLKEYFDNGMNKSKLSLYRLKNIILNDKTNLYHKPKINCIRKFEKTGDVSNISFETYPIEDYFNQLVIVLEQYKPIVQSIEDYRNNVYAHVGKLRDKENHQEQMTLKNIRKTINALKIIFDDLSYSIAPDKYVNIEINYNIWLSRLNLISQFYEKNEKDH